MNTSFRVIWNHSTQTWVAVSELAKGHTKAFNQSKSEQNGLFTLTALSLALLSASGVAAPTDNSATDATASGSWKLGINNGKNITTVDKNANQVLIKQSKNIVVTKSDNDNNIIIATSNNPNFNTVTTENLIVTNEANIQSELNVSGTTNLGDLNVSGTINLKSTDVDGNFSVNNGTTSLRETVINDTLDMTNHKITNVADAENDTDAVNKKQLTEAVNAAGSWTLGINDNEDITTVNNKDNLVLVKQSKNIVVTKSGNSITVATSDKPTFNSVTTNDLTANGTTTLKETIINGTLNMTGNKITGLTNATVEAGNTDAVNGGVLHTEVEKLIEKGLVFVGNNDGEKVKRRLGSTLQIVGSGKLADDQYSSANVKTVGNSANGIEIRIANNPTFSSLTTEGDVTVGGNQTVKKDLTVNGDFSAKGNTQIGGQGKNLEVIKGTNVNMGGNRIQNVATPIKSTDAANRGYVDSKLKDVGNKVHKLDRTLRAGVAGATAMAFIQRPHEAGKSMVSVATGGYKGESAVAVGYAHNSDNNRVSIKLGVGVNSRSDVTYGGSVGYQW